MDATAPALATGTALVDVPATAVMPARPDTPLERLKALPPKQKWMAGGGLAALLVLLGAMLIFNLQDKYAPLYAEALSEGDAGAIAAQLKRMDVRHKINGSGTQVLVPADRVGELRTHMATLGLPKGKPNGGAILDQGRFGQSAEQERHMRQRALQADLMNTMGAFGGVIEDARVHIAVPQQTGFFREQVKPTASVVVTLRPGQTLDRRQIAGIVLLVSRAVPDLSPQAVSIIDQDGNLLTNNPDGDGRQELTQQQRKHVLELEQSLKKRVHEILEPALGKGNLQATVTAEVDFNQVETTSEAFRPNQTADAAAIRSQRSIEQSGPGQPQPTGVPGAASNTPPTPPTAPASGPTQPLQAAQAGTVGGGNRKENQINYEVDRKVESTRHALGTLKRTTVAVLVNHRSVTDAKGKTSTQPVPAEELEKLTALVQEAVGFNKERGDSVKVVTMPFRADLYPKPEELPLWKQPWLLDLIKTAGIPLVLLLVALTLVFAVIRPALRKDEPETPETALEAVVDGPEALPGPEEAKALINPEDDISPFITEQLEHARLLARENPLAVANILRTWVHGEAKV
jgi:flagellar M-ring protein FliF